MRPSEHFSCQLSKVEQVAAVVAAAIEFEAHFIAACVDNVAVCCPVDEAVFLREKQGVYLGKQDRWLWLHGWLMHLSLIAYYVLETGWWFLQTCPEVDRALGRGGRWINRWDGQGTWSYRLERWFNWPLTFASILDLGWCVRRWCLLEQAYKRKDGTGVSAVVRKYERREIIMDFLGYFCGEVTRSCHDEHPFSTVWSRVCNSH